MFLKGVYKPMVKTRSIDDVPMLGITLWSDKMDDFQLRQIAEEVTSEIEKSKRCCHNGRNCGRSRVLIWTKIKWRRTASTLWVLVK
jgi:hypothetical protein